MALSLTLAILRFHSLSLCLSALFLPPIISQFFFFFFFFVRPSLAISLVHFSRFAEQDRALVSRVNPDEKIPWEYMAFHGRAIRVARGGSGSLTLSPRGIREGGQNTRGEPTPTLIPSGRFSSLDLFRRGWNRVARHARACTRVAMPLFARTSRSRVGATEGTDLHPPSG